MYTKHKPMKNTNRLLNMNFESSSGTTPEFLEFFKTFKREFTKELKSIGAIDIKFRKGHFYVNGFFTVNGQAMYFSLSDVRDFKYSRTADPYSCMTKLLYRTAKDYKDFTGGHNQYVSIESGMCSKMNI